MSAFTDENRVRFTSEGSAAEIDLGSLSSVGAGEAARADDSGLGLYDETMPLYQRLQELDQLTASFLRIRPLVLNDAHDTFSDLDPRRQQLFELMLPPLRESDVLCLSVSRVPRGAPTAGLSARAKRSTAQYKDTLDVSLKLANDSETVSGYHKAEGFDGDDEDRVVFVPNCFNGTYDFVLTPAHGLLPGKYILDVTNQSADEVVSVRVQHGVTQQVAATPLQAGGAHKGSVAANEFKFYRFVNHDPAKLVTIRVRPLVSAAGAVGGKTAPAGDPDLYVTNRYSGFVALTKDTALWRSTTVGVDRVDILPEDAEAARGNTYIIGVLGCKKTNDFEVSVNTSVPEKVLDFPVTAGGEDTKIVLSRGKYKYFRIPLGSSVKNQIVIKLEPSAVAAAGGVNLSDQFSQASAEAERASGNTALGYQRSAPPPVTRTSALPGPSPGGRHVDDMRATAMLQRFGRGVYSHDWFAEYGLYDAYFRAKRQEQKHPEGIGGFSSFQLAVGRNSFMRDSSVVTGKPHSGMLNATHSSSFMSNTSISPPSSPDRTGGSDHNRSLNSNNVFNSPTAAGYMTQPRGGSAQSPAGLSPFSGTAAVNADGTTILSEALGIEREALSSIFPPSTCRDSAAGIYPIVYMSSTCVYPSEENFMWRASAADGSIVIVLDIDEWRHNSGECYLSIFGLSIPEAAHLAHASGGVVANPSERCVEGAVPEDLSIQLSNWARQETFDMSERDQKAYKLFNKIYSEIDGSAASQRDRSASHSEDSNVALIKPFSEHDQAFTYGEVEFPSFLQVLTTADATDGQIFVDLGCGAGKALVAAALSDIRFQRVTGIELLPTLTACCRKAAAQLRDLMKGADDARDVTTHFETRLSASSVKSSQSRLPLMDIREGDFLEIDWSEADLVYISSICFPESALRRIFERATRLKVGSTLITLKLIPGFEKYFELKAEKWFKMSWGSILVYFLVRIAA